MLKEKIYISYYEDDGQTDVEVYEWSNENNTKGDLIEDLSDYAFESKSEADKHVEKLKLNYEIIKETSLQEEEKEIQTLVKKYEEKMKNKKIETLKPLYKTYEFDLFDFKERIEFHLFKVFKHPVNITLENGPDSETRDYLVIHLKKNKNPDWLVRNIVSYYCLDDEFEDIEIQHEVIEDWFGKKGLKFYWHPLHTEYDIVLNAPW